MQYIIYPAHLLQSFHCTHDRGLGTDTGQNGTVGNASAMALIDSFKFLVLLNCEGELIFSQLSFFDAIFFIFAMSFSLYLFNDFIII